MKKTKYDRDFFAEAHQILKNQGYKSYIQNLLPAGKLIGNEWVAKNPTRNDKKAGSFSVNIRTAKWSDFATGDAGNDLIGWTAYLKGITPIEACFYIGVERPTSIDKPKPTLKPVEAKKPPLQSKAPEIDLAPFVIAPDELEDQDNTAPLNFVIAGTNELTETEPTEESLSGQANDNTIDKIVELVVPEFTEELIGQKNKAKFKDGTLTLYHYYNRKGLAVGCVVRCDFEDEDKPKTFAQYSWNRISQKWIASWSEQGKPPYNLQEIIANPDKPVMVVEGEKVVEKAKHLFPEFVLTTSCMGALSARSTNWSFLKGRDVVVAPDNDRQGARYARDLSDILTREEAKSISGFDSKKLGRFIIIEGKPTRRDERVPEKYDLADSVEDGWTAELINEWKTHADFSPFFEATSEAAATRDLPKEGEEVFYIGGVNYKLSEKSNSLWWEKVETNARTGDTITTWVRLSGYMKPTHCTVDISGNHGLLVKIVTINSKKVECFFSREEFATEKDTTKLLLVKGLPIPHLRPANCYALNFYLNNFKPEFKAVGVDMVGWQNDNLTYILPFTDNARNSYSNHKEGEQRVEYILQQKGVVTRSLTRTGTLAEWQRTVGQVTRGNHLHTFAIIAALTAPALKLLNAEGGFFHYAGGTSLGKSTILHVAKSVWGYENLDSFRTTDNALESSCKNANDGTLFLDEIGQVTADALDNIVYMVANGATKGRSDRGGEGKGVRYFTVLAQSTGEIGLEAKLAEKNKQAKGGQIIRMIELDADRREGLNTFDVLNINPDTKKQFATGREQAEYLKTHAQANGGVVIDGFLTEIVKDVEGFKTDLKTAKLAWLQGLSGDEIPEVERGAEKFANVYATGVMAIEFGIIPHTISEIQQCVDAMFKNWFSKFGGNSSHELKVVLNNLYKLVIEQQHSRFCNAAPLEGEKENLPRDKAGYYKMAKNEQGEMVLSEVWVRPPVFEREVLKGQDKKTFYPLLDENSYLIREDKKNYPQKRRPAKENAQRFIVVNVATLLEYA